MADAWADFDFGSATAPAQASSVPAPPAPQPTQRTAPKSDAWSDFDFGSPAAASTAAPSTAAPLAGALQASPQTGPKAGLAANAAAGVVEGGSDILNTLSDPFGNLIGKPLVTLGSAAHDLLAPVFGYQKFTPEQRAAILGDQHPQPGTQAASAIGSALNAPPVDQVTPATTGQSLVRSGVRAGVGMAGLNVAGAPAGVLPGAIATGAVTGAAGGVTGEAAATLVPDEYKPVAALAGNLVGAGVPMAAGSALRSTGAAVRDYAAPILGRKNALADLDGQPIVGSDGAPLTANANQIRIAGNDLQAVTSDPAAVRATLDAQPAPIVPGAQPTTAQITRDPGLAMQEYRVARSGGPLDQAAFRGRADAQNDARVNVLQGVADGASPSALPQALQQQAADLDASGQARVQQVQQQTTAQMAQAQAMLDQRTAALRAQATQSADAMGGNLPPGSEAQVGAALRDPIAANLQATRAREGALWDAIDPDGSLAVDMTPVRDRANEVAQSLGPNAAPLVGDEAAIMDTARGLPDVQSFRDLADLRTRLTDTMRAARIDPTRAREGARLKVMLDSVHDAMAGRVTAQASRDAQAVQAGAMTPEQTMMARLKAQVDDFQTRRQQAVGSGGNDGADPSAVAPVGPSGFSGVGGATGASGRGPGDSTGNPSLQGQAPLTANFDQAAAQRYADARTATAQRAATFKNAPGVGQALQPGPTSGTFRTPDTAVSNIIVKAGPAGAETAKAYLAAGGSPQALSDAAAFSLRREAMRPDGTLDPVKYAGWAKQRSSFLSQIPDAAARFGDAAEAQRAADFGSETATQMLKDATNAAQHTVNDAMAARAAANKQMQTSAAGKFLGTADPVASVGSILRDRVHGRAQMALLAQHVKSNPEATAGLQRAVAEHIQRDLIGNTKGAASESGYIRNDRFQTFLKQAEPALREVMTPEQMRALKDVSTSLEQSNFSSQVGVGSPTAQLTAGRGETLLARVGREIAGPVTGGSVGAAVGSAFGPIGATTGSLLGGAIGKAVQAAREAGVSNVEHLKTEALLNPALFRLLMTKVTPENGASLTSQLTSQLRRVSLVSGVQASAGQEDHRQQRVAAAVAPPYAMKPNMLSGYGSPASAQPPPNALFDLARTAPMSAQSFEPRRNALFR